jgi:hypothetical protein
MQCMLSPATSCNAVQEEMGFVAELGALRSVSHPHLVQYLGCGINSEKQPDGTAPKRYLAIVCP